MKMNNIATRKSDESDESDENDENDESNADPLDYYIRIFIIRRDGAVH